MLNFNAIYQNKIKDVIKSELILVHTYQSQINLTVRELLYQGYLILKFPTITAFCFMDQSWEKLKIQMKIQCKVQVFLYDMWLNMSSLVRFCWWPAKTTEFDRGRYSEAAEMGNSPYSLWTINSGWAELTEGTILL